MVKCSFCGRTIMQSRIRIFVDAAGRVLNFCSGKCRKNLLLGRDAKRVKWVQKKEK